MLDIENKSFDDNSFAMSRQNFIYHIKKNTLFVYEEKSLVCGYILLLLRKNSKKIRVYSLAVDKSFMGLGIASKLLKKSFLYALENSKNLIRLEVKINNTKAINLYKKYDFLHIKTLKSYYPDKSDAFVMQKVLFS
ncbi:MAG: GNAT family N-acetyltransferase [Campylobacteraceae bacterium]|nr:GNAT family N-acetyltransferase [Campylobacteraceae bacterium]